VVSAGETNLQELLEGAKQYRVPLYQRTYAWTDVQLGRLWDDVVQIAEDRVSDPKATHFIGSLVLAPSPTNGPAGVSEFLVVDGQQRLTTLTVLLAAIRDHRAANEDPVHRGRINDQFLINNYKPEPQRIKLVPTQADRSAYNSVVDQAHAAQSVNGVHNAYRFFSVKIAASDDPDDPHDIERIENAVLRGLALVSVVAQAGDNAHRIFESLNNTGLKLTQGDLLRNYLFMRLPTKGEQVYQSTWLPMQEALSSDDLELLFWLDLVQENPAHRQSETYSGQQRRLDKLRTESEIEEEISRFRRLGALLVRVLTPALEPDPAVRLRLQRLKGWGTTTVYPILLRLLDLRDRGEATSEQVASAAHHLESYLVRRLIVGRSTSGINRILLATVNEMPKDLPVDEAIRSYLSTGRKHFATDAAITAAVQTAPFYLTGRPNQRNLVLRWLEESYGNKEPVNLSGLTIEHVLPQTLTAEWRAELSANDEEYAERLHLSLVHTLANLTLTGYNSTLSNSPFAVKRSLLSTSGLRMNQEIAKEEHWGAHEIELRGIGLAQRVNDIWPGPTSSAPVDDGPNWSLLASAMTALPAGGWTTYGDLAALIGNHAVPVGNHLASAPVPNAHRVLRADRTVSPDFRWGAATDNPSPRVMLEAEGVHFNAAGQAASEQRFDARELAVLVGLEPEALPLTHSADGTHEGGFDGFIAQLSRVQSEDTAQGVRELVSAWTSLGGKVEFGSSAEVSCYLMARDGERMADKVWPVTIYPSGKVEVVFQWMTSRPPFDAIELREEFRRRLNEVAGVDLPAAKVSMRPGFSVELLADTRCRDQLVRQLGWFFTEANRGEAVTQDDHVAQ
jgi:alkylated DNA nucleotide flippase Atl1